jgi:putative endonuclease
MNKQDPRRSLGSSGEAIAVHALEQAGLTIVERNWHCAVGEIDIVAQENGPDYARGLASTPWLVLVEVRTRRGDTYGTALQSVVPRKQRKLRQVARTYVQHTDWRGPWRIDVVGIQMDSQGQVQSCEHIRHAVRDE